MNKINESQDSLSTIISIKEQELSDNFVELKNILTKYESDIFTSFLVMFQDDVDSKIKNKRWQINQSLKPYHILKIGQDFLNFMGSAMSGEVKPIFDDNRDLLKKVFDPCNTYGNVFYDYELKSDYRINQCFDGDEKKAYTILRNEIQKFIEMKDKEGIKIWFSKAYYENVDCGSIHLSLLRKPVK